MLAQLTDFVLGAATSPWSFVVVGALIIIDAVFPVVPSESLVISLSSLLYPDHRWHLLVLWAMSLTASWVGDNLAFTLGGTKWLGRRKLLRRPRFAKSLDWAREKLYERGATVIIAGRFLPGARVAINVTCGLVGYSRTKFRALVVVSATLWATFSVVIGAVAGAWLERNPLLGIVIAVAIGVAVGPVIDWLLRKTVLRNRRDLQAPPAQAASAAEDDAPYRT